MLKQKNSFKKALVTNIGIAVIIALVYFCAFMPFDIMRGPVMKGSTNGENIALQIAVNDSSDIGAYMDSLDAFGIKGTFFFPEQFYMENRQVIRRVIERGNGIGYYVCKKDDGQRLVLYIGGGYSVPVMSYVKGSRVVQVCPSIDVDKLKNGEDWQQILGESLLGDMFIYTNADNNLHDFKKVVQIVLNKGYTILKMDEML